MNKNRCIGKFYVTNERINNPFYGQAVRRMFKAVMDKMTMVKARQDIGFHRSIEYTTISPAYFRELQEGESIPEYRFTVVVKNFDTCIIAIEVI